MPADIHLLPHKGCIRRPTLIGERRFLKLVCPPEPSFEDSALTPELCRLCGISNGRHRVRYQIRWSVPAEDIVRLVKHAQCPKCRTRIRTRSLVEIRKLRGDTQTVETYSIAKFAGMLTANGREMESGPPD